MEDDSVCVSESNLFSIFESCGVFFFTDSQRGESHRVWGRLHKMKKLIWHLDLVCDLRFLVCDL